MKLILDIILLVLFGALCNTAVIGVAFHEVAGIVYAALIVVHLVFNRKWLAAAFKGKLKGKKSVATAVINIALALNLLVLLCTGIRASHFLFVAAVKAPSYIIVVHAISGIIAAGLVLAPVLVHTKVIIKKKLSRKIALTAVLIIVIGYSFYGGVQGTLHHAIPKEPKENVNIIEPRDENHDDGERKQKDGEKK